MSILDGQFIAELDLSDTTVMDPLLHSKVVSAALKPQINHISVSFSSYLQGNGLRDTEHVLSFSEPNYAVVLLCHVVIVKMELLNNRLYTT
jgi:hypothetical protein